MDELHKPTRLEELAGNVMDRAVEAGAYIGEQIGRPFDKYHGTNEISAYTTIVGVGLACLATTPLVLAAYTPGYIGDKLTTLKNNVFPPADRQKDR